MSTTGTRVLVLLLILIGALLLAIGVPLLYFSSKGITTSMNPYVVDIPPGERWFYTLSVQRGDVVRIELSVSGGKGDIYFSITDPYGYYVYGPLRVYNSLSYEFKATESGYYYLTFDNTFSLITTKHVSLNIYIKNQPDSGFGYAGIMLIVFGITMLATGLLMYTTTSKTSRSRATSETHGSQPSEAGARAPS